MSRILILIGVLMILIGGIMYLSEKYPSGWFSWFGNLPGDIKIEKENFKFYFPFTSMLILSIVLSVLIKVLKRFF